MAHTPNHFIDDQYTSNIGQRLFAYTYHQSVIQNNPGIAQQFKKSLIFLGYEGQIWSPLTNTYVGIGKTSYDATITYVAEAHAKIDALNTALTSSMVSNIYANWDPSEWKNAVGGADIKSEYLAKIGATNDIVLRGIGDYDTVNNRKLTQQHANVTDDNAGKAGIGKEVSQDALNTAYKELGDGQWATSGITVSLVKERNWYRIERIATEEEAKKGGPKVAAWVEGFPVKDEGGTNWKDEKGNLTSYAAADVATETAYAIAKDTGGEYIFKNGKNTLTIDDTQTWSYITQKTAYAMDFAKHYTSTEVNRIYAEILGLAAGESIIPVTYAQIHEIQENSYAVISTAGDEFVVKEFNKDNIYVKKTALPTNWDGTITGGEDKDAYYTLDGVTYITVEKYLSLAANDRTAYQYLLAPDSNLGKSITVITDPRTESPKGEENKTLGFSYTTSKYNLGFVLEIINTIVDPAKPLDPNGEYYVLNEDYTASLASENINLADGINTLKEVAYVLDQITNGSMDPNNPENSGIELAYSIAQNHIDIIDLDARLDELEAGRGAVRSIKNNPADGRYVDVILSTDGGDECMKVEGGLTYYYQDVNIHAELNIAYTGEFTTVTTDAPAEGRYVPVWTRNETTADKDYGNTTLASEVGAAFTYATDRHHEGLVDVNWALTYGAELRQVIQGYDIEKVKAEAQAFTYQVVDALDATHTVYNSQVFSYISQVNGLLQVGTPRELPTDIILANAEVWGETGSTTPKEYNEVTTLNEELLRETPLYVQTDDFTYVKAEVDTNGVVTETGIDFYYLDQATQTFAKANNDDHITPNGYGRTHKNYVELYKQVPKYIRIDAADIVLGADGTTGELTIGGKKYIKFYTVNKAGVTAQVKYISATQEHHTATAVDGVPAKNDGGNTLKVTAHITKIEDATESNSGLADAYDVRNTLNHMFEWIDLSEWAERNNPMNYTGAPTT